MNSLYDYGNTIFLLPELLLIIVIVIINATHSDKHASNQQRIRPPVSSIMIIQAGEGCLQGRIRTPKQGGMAVACKVESGPKTAAAALACDQHQAGPSLQGSEPEARAR